MTDYSNALRQQQHKIQEEVDGIIPDKNAVPLIVTSPYCNSSILINPNPWVFDTDMCCDYFTARWITDTTINDLTSSFSSLGISLFPAEYDRARIDLDRQKNSYNPGHSDRPIGITPDDDDLYAAMGMGVVWARIPGDTETPLYIGDHQPTQKQIEGILEIHDSYHTVLKALVNQHMDRFGGSLHISIQPFSKQEAIMLGADPDNIPQFVISNADGDTSGQEFFDRLHSSIVQKGYLVAPNTTFPTGEITRQHASPKTGAHAIQLKVFEEIYLDVETLENKREIRKISRDLHAIMTEMAEYARQQIKKSQPKADVLKTPYNVDKSPKPVTP